MAIGERIRFLRNLRGMTQKYLGGLMGFPEKSADVRMAQYETGARTPKADMTEALAQVLDVSPHALNVPNIDNLIGVAHTLFALEDIYGLTIEEENGLPCLQPNVHKSDKAYEICSLFESWYTMSAKYRTGEITKEEYDQWRYHYPLSDSFTERRKRRQSEAAHEPQNESFRDSSNTDK